MGELGAFPISQHLDTLSEPPLFSSGAPQGLSLRRALNFTRSFEKAKQLLSHALPTGDLELLFERALDELINREMKRRMGAGKPRKPRALRVGSRHVPLEVARQVWERDVAQCLIILHLFCGTEEIERAF